MVKNMIVDIELRRDMSKFETVTIPNLQIKIFQLGRNT